MKNAKEAIRSYIETLLVLNEPVSIGNSKIEDLIKKEEYANAIWAIVNIDFSDLDSKPERIDISLPRFILKKLIAMSILDMKREVGSCTEPQWA